MFSVCSHLGGGGARARSRPGGGYPNQVQSGGLPWLGGTPMGGTPHQTWPGGYPGRGYPGGTPPRVPPIRPGRGGTPMGVPHLGYPPPVTPGWGGTPTGRVPHRVVLDTPRSVCLLRSRRRTFLLQIVFIMDLLPLSIADRIPEWPKWVGSSRCLGICARSYPTVWAVTASHPV